MNKSQQSAIDAFRRYLERDAQTSKVADLQVTKWEVRENGGCLFVSAQLECGPSVGENSLLRVLSHEWWLVQIGNRGAIDVLLAPKSYQQFKGKRAFSMNFKRDLSIGGA